MPFIAYCKKIKFSDLANHNSAIDSDELCFLYKKNLLKKGKSYIKKFDNYFEFHKENFGTFEIYKNLIHYNLVEKFTDDVKLSICLNQPMACNAYLNDFLVMHCSAFYYKNRSYLLLGESGSGKSTLLFHMLRYAKFITEDIGVFDKYNHIHPSFPITKIAGEHLKEEFLKSKSRIPFDERGRYACKIYNKYFRREPALVGGIFILNRCERENISALSLTEKISAIYSSSLRLIENADNEYEEKFFEKAGILAKNQAFKINIPFSEDATRTAKKLIQFLDKHL